MSLDFYFKRNNDKKNDNKEPDKIIRIRDDFEILPNYFIKKQLYDKMFDHQKEGVKWLFSIYSKGKGAVLADDMGLGKTIQTIGLLSSLFRYRRIKHVLIIAPTTLLINWKQEFKKWADFEMFITTIDGSVQANKRSQLIDSIQASDGILMLTYNLARTLQEELSTFRGKEFVWDYVVLDEAHKIKNQTKTTRELNQLPSRLRLAITGTPVQNNLSELWSIYNFAMQGTLLGTYATFKRIYEKPITTARKKDATVREKVLGNKIAQSLRKIYEPYLLRRTKEEVFGVKLDQNDLLNSDDKNQNLPPKYDWCVWIKMNKTQIKLYEEFLNSDEIKEILFNRTAVKSPLMQLLVLKKICDHPRLLSKNTFEKLIYDEDVDLDALNSVDVPVDLLLKESSKLSVLNQLLRILVEEKHKTLIFSSSTKMLDIIEKVLKLNKINFVRLDGQITSNEKREQIVKNFKKNLAIPVMLLTVQVGGVGLNLTEACRVIIYNPDWNPGTDAQAIDRSYRIGQKNANVIVYRFMTATGVEEKIYSRQVFKDSLTKQTIGKENDPSRYFTSQDLYELFKTGDFTRSKVCDEFNELHGTLEDKLLKELQQSGNENLTNEQQSVLRHKEELRTKINEIYDISEHSLVFSKKTEMLNTSDADFAYLNNEVKTAKELLIKESLLANGSRNSKLELEYQNTKQRLLTQQFGVEFLPLGSNFNQYRDGKNKFEFKRPKPKSPLKVVIDDDDDIQFIDTSTNKIMPSSSNYNKQSNTEIYKLIDSSSSDGSDININNSSDSSIDSLLINNSNDKLTEETNENSSNDSISSNSTYHTSKNSIYSPIDDSINNENNAPAITINASSTEFNQTTNLRNKSPEKQTNSKFASPIKSINIDNEIADISLNISLMDFEENNRNNLSVLSNDISELTNSFETSIRIDDYSKNNSLNSSMLNRASIDKEQKKDKDFDDSIIILD